MQCMLQNILWYIFDHLQPATETAPYIQRESDLDPNKVTEVFPVNSAVKIQV